MRILALAFALTMLPAVAQAQQTPSLRDIVELSKAGVSEDVLLALIEVHRPVYPVDPETLKGLKAAGVSSKVMVAMVKSGREPELPVVQPPASPTTQPVLPPAPQPQVVVIDHERETPRVREVAVPVAVPVAYPVYSRFVYPVRADRPGTETPPRRKAEPVYWGWGGKLRPDAWKPEDTKKKR